MTFDITSPAFENWVDVIPEKSASLLQQVGTFKNGSIMMASYLENVHEQLEIYNFDVPAKLVKNVELPGYGAVPQSSGGHHDFEFFFKF